MPNHTHTHGDTRCGTFSSPAVSMLLSNCGVMDQLQTILSSSSSSAPSVVSSAASSSALLCCSHLLLSSLITLQHEHSIQVHAVAPQHETKETLNSNDKTAVVNYFWCDFPVSSQLRIKQTLILIISIWAKASSSSDSPHFLLFTFLSRSLTVSIH